MKILSCLSVYKEERSSGWFLHRIAKTAAEDLELAYRVVTPKLESEPLCMVWNSD